MGLLWAKARTVTTSLDRTASMATLNTLANAIRDRLKAGGANDIGATDVFVQWHGTAMEIVVVNDALLAVTADLSVLRTAIKNGCEAQAAISAVTAADIDVFDRSSPANTAGASWTAAHTSTAAPTVNNDSSDTAGLGKTFGIGSVWMQTNVTSYLLEAATPGAALWVDIRKPPPLGVAITPIFHWAPSESLLNTIDANAYALTNVALQPVTAGGRRKAVLFNGSTAYSQSAAIPRPANYTTFTVVRPTSTANQIFHGACDTTGGNAVGWGWVGIRTTRWYAVYGNDTTYRLAETSVAAIDTLALITTRHAAGDGNPQLWLNGVTQSVTTSIGTATSSAGDNRVCAVGRPGQTAASYSSAYIGEVLVVGSALAAETRAAVETALMARWGIV